MAFGHPFFIMHLPELPTIFVKGGEERKAYFTIQAKELLEAGWVIKGTEEVVEEKAAEEPAPKTKTRRAAKKPVETSEPEVAEE